MDKKDNNLVLEKYADLIVKVGLNLQPGQKLFIVGQAAGSDAPGPAGGKMRLPGWQQTGLSIMGR